MRELTLPLSAETVRNLHAGDLVELSGVIITARDAAHKYMVEELIQPETPADAHLYARLRQTLAGGAIYHCGPVVERRNGAWRFVAAGPTTSMREEAYESEVIEHFGVRAIIGKGGMGPQTLAACENAPAVYLHAPGGAAVAIARHITEVLTVDKLEFGQPEAMWQVRVAGLPLMVTMDAHKVSWHERIAAGAAARLQELLNPAL